MQATIATEKLTYISQDVQQINEMVKKILNFVFSVLIKDLLLSSRSTKPNFTERKQYESKIKCTKSINEPKVYG